LRSYLRLLRFVAPYRGRFAAAIGCMAILAIANASYVQLLGPALDFLFTGKADAVASLGRFVPGLDVASWVEGVDRARLLAVFPLVIIAVAIVKGIAYFGQFFLMGMLSQRVIADLRQALFSHLLRLSPAFYAKRHSGDLLSRFSADVQAVEMAVSNAVASYIRDGLTVIVMLASCFLLDWRLSLIAFGAVPITLFPIVRLAKRLKRVTLATQTTLGQIAEIVQESLTGMRVVQAFGMERFEAARLDDANRRWLKQMRRSYLVRAFSSPLMEVMAAVGLAAAIYWVGGRILAGQLDAAKFFSFVAAVLLLYTPVKQLGRVGQMAMQGMAASERIHEVLDTPTPVPDSGSAVLPPFRDAVRYEAVSFSYGDAPILRELSLEIRKGEVVALVGASGSGKTTIANLLPRFWDVSGGRIAIDGLDVREATLASVRAQIAIVTQETVLFNDTVRGNIAYGRPEVPLGEVERAARMAQAHEFILALPHGYDTIVGEKGVLLSGGQRQRIAIARAFLRDAPILVLDEATSALDAESEREVQRALDGLMGLLGQAQDERTLAHAQGERTRSHRTTLVIAHRLSTIRNADRIVVLSGGRVVETGPHDELLARGGEYARLYRIYEGDRHVPARAQVG
jgi:ATP-binding cassette, subfamily B, bacterial MsbA